VRVRSAQSAKINIAPSGKKRTYRSITARWIFLADDLQNDKQTKMDIYDNEEIEGSPPRESSKKKNAE